jgi:hypothetical protein
MNTPYVESAFDRDFRLQQEAEQKVRAARAEEERKEEKQRTETLRRDREFNRQVDFHSGEVHRALKLHWRRLELQKLAGTFDSSEEFRNDVAKDRAAHHAMLTTWIFFVIIGLADLFLATPDVSRRLADKAVAFISEKLAETQVVMGVTLTSAPYWLRISVGLALVSIWLGITYLIKRTTDETQNKADLLRLEPRDYPGKRKIRQAMLGKRFFKLAYMGSLAGVFSLFFLWDVERAKMEISSKKLNESADVMKEIQLPTGQNNSIAETSNGLKQANLSETEEIKRAALFQASPSLAVYFGLLMLHGCILLLPLVPAGHQSRHANFDRNAIGEEIGSLENEEKPLSLRIGDRILATTDSTLRQRFFRIAEPLVPRINELYGRPILVINHPPTNGQRAEMAGQPAQPEVGTPMADRPVQSPNEDESRIAAHNGVNGINGHNGNPPPASYPINGEGFEQAMTEQPAANEEAPSVDYDAIFGIPRKV